MKKSLGKVAVTPGGFWRADKSYEALTSVVYEVNGNGYISLIDNIGIAPETKEADGVWVIYSMRGFSIYDLCVKSGKFTGTEQEFIQQYTNAVTAAREAAGKCEADAKKLLSSISASASQQLSTENETFKSQLSGQEADFNRFMTGLRSQYNAEEQAFRTKSEQWDQAEAGRAKAEGARKTAEEQRASAERTRNTNETSRTDAENGRKTSEKERAAAEKSREVAERKRETDSSTATSAANTAATQADEATTAANAAKAAALAASEAAKQSVTKVETALTEVENKMKEMDMYDDNVATLFRDLKTILATIDHAGHHHALDYDTEGNYMVCGHPLRLEGHGAPSAETIPDQKGIPASLIQIYINRDASSRGAYYAVGTTSVSDWRQF